MRSAPLILGCTALIAVASGVVSTHLARGDMIASCEDTGWYMVHPLTGGSDVLLTCEVWEGDEYERGSPPRYLPAVLKAPLPDCERYCSAMRGVPEDWYPEEREEMQSLCSSDPEDLLDLQECGYGSD